PRAGVVLVIADRQAKSPGFRLRDDGVRAGIRCSEQHATAKGATMTSAAAGLVTANESKTASIQAHLDRATEDLLASLPNPGELTAEQRRGIIARYTAVLEGNFIYWMTGAYIAAGSDEARAKIMENLR